MPPKHFGHKMLCPGEGFCETADQAPRAQGRRQQRPTLMKFGERITKTPAIVILRPSEVSNSTLMESCSETPYSRSCIDTSALLALESEHTLACVRIPPRAPMFAFGCRFEVEVCHKEA